MYNMRESFVLKEKPGRFQKWRDAASAPVAAAVEFYFVRQNLT